MTGLPVLSSLRARLLAAVMLPLLALIVTVGVFDSWRYQRQLYETSDRILIGSVRVLSRAIDADAPVRRDLLQLAVHLLQRRGSPTTFYSVYRGDRLLAGRPDLKPPADYTVAHPMANNRHPAATFTPTFRRPALVRGYVDARDARGVIQPGYLRDGNVGGRSLRIATEIRFIQNDPVPIAVQVGDFIDDRASYLRTRYLQVFATGVFVSALALLLFYAAITWGLRHFAALARQIEAEQDAPPLHFRLHLEQNAPREARLLAVAFNALLGRTQRAIESLCQFTANASHQLRTPLAVVRLHLDLLERFGSDSPQGRQAMDDMASAVTSLERLLLQLLSLARSDELPLDRNNVFDLLEVAKVAIGEHVSQAGKAEVKLGFRAPPGCNTLPAAGHAALVAEIIHNLVDNAIRYNRPGGRVTLSVAREDGHARLTVEDDGPGIPLSKRAKVWERFFRLPVDSASDGSGLGLSIVRALADRMRAVISLDDGPNGRGLAVNVLFPIASVADSGRLETRGQTNPAASELANACRDHHR